jgi:hypothetical protein
MLRLLLLVALMPGLNYPGTPPVGGGGDEEIFNLAASPHGGWTAPQYPRAVYYNGKSYFAWVNGGTGAIFIASYDHSTETVQGPTQLDSMAGLVDTHHNPAILIRDSDKRILVAFSLHGGPNMFLMVSTNPEDVTSFAAATNLDSSLGGGAYTYPALVQLTGVASDPIYLLWRNNTSGSGASQTGELAYSTSTDGGTTWAAQTRLLTGASTHIPYWQIASDYDTRIDILSTDRDAYASDGAVDVGHFYIDGTDGNYYQSDGTEITASLPFLHSELTQLETNVVASLPLDGISGVNPTFTYGVDIGSSRLSLKHARWDGAAWDKNEIDEIDNHPLDRFYCYAAINRADTDEVFTGVKTGASSSELYSYVTLDSGATWSGTAVTSGSTNLNAAPIPVVQGVATMPVMWLRGWILSSSSFSFAIHGLRR